MKAKVVKGKKAKGSVMKGLKILLQMLKEKVEKDESPK